MRNVADHIDELTETAGPVLDELEFAHGLRCTLCDCAGAS